MIDTGDGNQDYTLNNWIWDAATAQASHRAWHIHPQSSLLWLARQQGYRQSAMKAAFRTDTATSPFLRSLRAECANTTTSMNAFTCLVQLPLETVIDTLHTPGTWTVDPGTTCGLYDSWNGTGGSLAITIERPVIIPSRYVDLYIDGTCGYSVQSTYGITGQRWKPTAHFTPRRSTPSTRSA